jgi:phosphoribosylaminoimidazolecarboxamide formyltransferase / IMP cyclohydrolase
MGRLALLSVSDKSGLVEFARGLVAAGFAIVSSGGTAQSLKAAGVPVTKVSDYTGSPEILGGRVKTLHPKIHGGILARRDVAADLADLEANGIAAFDLVAVNLYPFAQTVAKPGVTLADAIENIDIGGPAMIRATAKNFSQLTVLCNPSQYPAYLTALQENDGVIPLAFRQARALEAFEHTAAYDAAIVAYLRLVTASSEAVAETETAVLPTQVTVTGQQVQSMRYGENPHQAATWYASDDGSSGGWATAKQLQGKALSYNNLVDLEAARQLIAEFGGDPAAAILKHNNPCGVAQRGTIAEAYQAAFAADSTSAFGGIVALNRGIDAATAQALTQTFLECVVAPSCDPEAAAILAAKPNLRILTLADLSSGPSLMIKPIAGGFLAQAADDAPADPSTWTIATEAQPTEADLAELLFAWQVVRHVKSNAIVITQNRTTLGVGAGQMNRVGSAQIALTQAGDRAKGAILASDGFFPFDDSVRTAAAAGIRAIVQPGGSMRDADSVKAANELGVIMMLTGQRHFLH